MSVLSRIAHDWCNRVFGAEHNVDIPTRGLRMVEEAIELCQALDVSPTQVHELVDIVYARKTGNPYQELGGVLMTTVILAEQMHLDYEVCLETEVRRVLNKLVEHFVKRNAEKPVAFNEQKTMAPRHPADRSGKDPDMVRHFRSTPIGPVEDMPPYRLNAPGEVGTYTPEDLRLIPKPEGRHHYDAPDAEDKMRFVNMPSGTYTAGGIGGDGFAGIPHDGGFSADFAPSGQDCIDNDEGA